MWEGWLYGIIPNVKRFEDFESHSLISIFIRFFFTLLRHLHVFFSILPAYPGLRISMSKLQNVITSSKMDFISGNPDINQTYRSSKLYLKIEVCFLLLQQIWKNMLDRDYYLLRYDAMKCDRSFPKKFRMNMYCLFFLFLANLQSTLQIQQ
jgi:hypothetical protein